MTLPTTPDEATALADRILGGDNPLENEQVQAVLVKAAMDHMKGGTTFDQGGFLADVQHVLQPYMRNMLDLASWIKDPEAHATLGLQISLVDVFSAWGEREARDTAMMIDLCLAAALEQLGGSFVRIEAGALTALAESGRITRMKAEANAWSIRLLPDLDSPIDYGAVIEYSRGFEDEENTLGLLEACYLRSDGTIPTYRHVCEAGFPAFLEWVGESGYLKARQQPAGEPAEMA